MPRSALRSSSRLRSRTYPPTQTQNTSSVSTDTTSQTRPFVFLAAAWSMFEIDVADVVLETRCGAIW
eukprot:2331906-Rhodomonas_salina.1